MKTVANPELQVESEESVEEAQIMEDKLEGVAVGSVGETAAAETETRTEVNEEGISEDETLERVEVGKTSPRFSVKDFKGLEKRISKQMSEKDITAVSSEDEDFDDEVEEEQEEEKGAVDSEEEVMNTESVASPEEEFEAVGKTSPRFSVNDFKGLEKRISKQMSEKDITAVSSEDEGFDDEVEEEQEEENVKVEEEEALLAEQKAKADEEARLAQEARKAEEEAAIKAEEERKAKEEEEAAAAKLKAEEEAKAKAEAEAKAKAEEEERLKAAEKEAAMLAEQEAKLKAETEEEADPLNMSMSSPVMDETPSDEFTIKKVPNQEEKKEIDTVNVSKEDAKDDPPTPKSVETLGSDSAQKSSSLNCGCIVS